MTVIDFIEAVLIAVALAMDCFSVSMATGLNHNTVKPFYIWRMAIFFGLFQALMPLLGWLVSSYFGTYIMAFDHWIAFTLLAFIGTKMIIDYFKKEEAKAFDPEKLSVVVLLAFATSIDALAVGVSFECMGRHMLSDIISSIIIIGIVSWLFSLIGFRIGATIGRRFKFPAELIGGIILIGIGIKVLIEHMM
jgi:putative Mn2+ efflux pump MntP